MKKVLLKLTIEKALEGVYREMVLAGEIRDSEERRAEFRRMGLHPQEFPEPPTLSKAD